MVTIYLWSIDQSRKQTARMLGLSNNAIGRVFRCLEDICSIDIGRNLPADAL